MPLDFQPVGGASAQPFTPSTPSSGSTIGGAFAASAGHGLAEFSPQGATNIRVRAKIAVANLPQNLPAVAVAPGLKVILTGMNGQTTNAANVFVGLYPEELNDAGRLLAPGVDIEFPVDNIGQIWIKGALGDGVMVHITGPAVG